MQFEPTKVPSILFDIWADHPGCSSGTLAESPMCIAISTPEPDKQTDTLHSSCGGDGAKVWRWNDLIQLKRKLASTFPVAFAQPSPHVEPATLFSHRTFKLEKAQPLRSYPTTLPPVTNSLLAVDPEVNAIVFDEEACVCFPLVVVWIAGISFFLLTHNGALTA
jgi:hypothetical protein